MSISLVSCSSSDSGASDSDQLPDTSLENEEDVKNDADLENSEPDTDELYPDEDSICEEQFFETVMIEMRDGKKLAALVRRPIDESCKMPVILIQTPYNKNSAEKIWFKGELPSEEPLFSNRNYSFVIVDWRGFFESEDAKVEGQQPYGNDGYDCVEWIAEQSWSNEKIGTWGVSALGVQQYRTAVKQPPHLTAAVPIFSSVNVSYSQYYPGGVLRKEYMDFLNYYYGPGIVEEHPHHDNVWKYGESLYKTGAIEIPVMVVSGWYDLHNRSTIDDYRSLVLETSEDVNRNHRLLIGDWFHQATGGEGGTGRTLSEQEKLWLDTEKVIQKESVLFFDRHLRGVESGINEEKPVKFIFSGEKKWETAASWPPATEISSYILNESRALSTEMEKSGDIEFEYDPETPSPTIGGQTLRLDMPHGPMDQAEVISHKEAVVFTTTPMAIDLSIAGSITVDLKVKTSGEDTDFAIRLTDMDKDGNHLLIGEGIRRLKLRGSYEKALEVTPGNEYEIEIPIINELAYTFKKGNRLGVIVTSSNYPRFNKNPNTGADFFKKGDPFSKVTNTLILDGFSKINLPVIK